MRALFLTFHLLIGALALAQPGVRCVLRVPNAVTPNMEVTQATCACPITTFNAKLLNRWGNEVWSTTKLDGFPADLLSLKAVPDGTYYWMAKYTVVFDSRVAELEQKGHFTLIR